MSAEAIDFGYISDDLGDGVRNAHGLFTSVWAENTGPEVAETGRFEDRLTVRLEDLRGFAPEVDDLLADGWEFLGFNLEVTSYNAAAVGDYVDYYQADYFEREHEEEGGAPISADELAAQARDNIDEDAGAQAHLVLSRALRVPTEEHDALVEHMQDREQELPVGLEKYDGPFLTATLHGSRIGTTGQLHVETHHAGYPSIIEHPERAIQGPSVDADFLPTATWANMTSLRNKLHDAAVTHMGSKIAEEAALSAAAPNS